VVAHGAHLVLRTLIIRGTLMLDLQGTVTMEDSLVLHQPAIHLRDGRAEIVRSRLVGGGPGAVVQALSGQLDLDAVVVEPSTTAEVGIDLGAGVSVTMRDVSVNGVTTGVRCDGARLPAINGLSVSASDTGLWWRGQRDPGWSWERLQFQAPKPVQGLDLPPAGTAADEGARPERLGLVPPGEVARR